jgi:SPP1 gp7 family putative phage head morphogenesis protein
MIKEDIDKNVQFVFKEMLKSKRREIPKHMRKRAGKTVPITIWLYPVGQEKDYERYLFDLMDVYSITAMPEIRRNIQRWAEEVRGDSAVKSDDFNTEFQQLINDLNKIHFNMFDENGNGVEEFNHNSILGFLALTGFSIATFNQKQRSKFNKKVLGQDFIPGEPWLQEMIDAWAANNFELISSLSKEYIKKLNTIVSEGVLDGRTWDDIMRDLRKMDKNMTRSRSRLLARDQVGKLNARITKRRNQEQGVILYKWKTAQDVRVRLSHRKLNNKICSWNDNSVYADSIEDALAGKWKSREGAGMYIGTPGSDIQCRCAPIPIYRDMIEESDQEVAEEVQVQ